MTPSGELHIGMTRDQIARLLQSEVRANADTAGLPHASMVDVKIGNRAISAILTTKGIVYSIQLQETYPADPVGIQAAEAAFQTYLNTYASPTKPPIIHGPEATIDAWTTTEGHSIRVVLMCDETVLIVGIADYQLQLKDDGVTDEKRQYFRDGFSGPYSPARCF
ncbi:hypothetical protein [Rhizobium sp. BR 314]|uniref:hypothetical protein n=1 Tax=Rhizobium sp. BR 314 TaxID=3040013 RepID=UPI0039BEFD36